MREITNDAVFSSSSDEDSTVTSLLLPTGAAGADSRSSSDAVSIISPRRSVETWFSASKGETPRAQYRRENNRNLPSLHSWSGLLCTEMINLTMFQKYSIQRSLDANSLSCAPECTNTVQFNCWYGYCCQKAITKLHVCAVKVVKILLSWHGERG